MGINQGGSDFIRQVVGSVVNVFQKNKKKFTCTAPCDGFVLKLHYQWSFRIFLGIFSVVYYHWYYNDNITCVSHFNAGNGPREDVLNICLSYPYVDREDQPKRYILFYKWLQWGMCLVAFCFYIPRKLSKAFENPRLRKLFNDLANNSQRYDITEGQLVDIAGKYLAQNMHTHNGLFFKYVICNIVALTISILSFFFLNFMLQGSFLSYGWISYPFTRDPIQLTDHMSTVFPAFVKCTITPVHKLLARRTEQYGCHLPMMEMYEKVFLGIWIWLIVLSIITVCHICFLVCFISPWMSTKVLKISKPLNASNRVTSIIHNVVKKCNIGDTYVLYRLKQHLSTARYYELLSKLADENYMRDMVQEPNPGSANQERPHMPVNIQRMNENKMQQNRQQVNRGEFC